MTNQGGGAVGLAPTVAFSAGPVSGTLGGPKVLQAVTAEAYPGFDRIVFGLGELSPIPAAAAAGRPATYAVAADAPPFTSHASGEPMPVDGRAFIRIDFLEVFGHDPAKDGDAGALLVMEPDLGVVAQVYRSDDFEGYVELIVGLARGAKWRVTQLANPPRLILDVENAIRLGAVGS